MRLLILGDLHASWANLEAVMLQVDFNLKIKYDAVIQVGDFGFYASTFDKLDKFKYKVVKNPTMPGSDTIYTPLKFHKPVYCIDGNHEDHKWLKNSNHEEWKSKYNIFYQPRGSWLDINGYKIGFMGGALNADRPQEGSIDKETTNYILNKQVKRTLAEWNALGGLNAIVTHSCPSNIGIGMEGHPALYMAVQKYIVEAGFGDNNSMDCGDAPLTMLYRGLEKKPPLWFFGHFHTSKNKMIDQTEFMCVGSTDSSDARRFVYPLILDTKHGKIEYHNRMALNFDGLHSTRIL